MLLEVTQEHVAGCQSLGHRCTSCTCFCSPGHGALGTNREQPHWPEINAQGILTLGWTPSRPRAPLPRPLCGSETKAKFSPGVVTFTAAFRASENKGSENTTSFPRKTEGALRGGFYWLVKRHLSVPVGCGCSTFIIQEAPANSPFPARGFRCLPRATPPPIPNSPPGLQGGAGGGNLLHISRTGGRALLKVTLTLSCLGGASGRGHVGGPGQTQTRLEDSHTCF